MADQAEETAPVDIEAADSIINLPEARIQKTLNLLEDLRGKARQRIRGLEETGQKEYGARLSPTDHTKGLRKGLDNLLLLVDGAIDGITLAANIQKGKEPEWLTNARIDFGLPDQKQLVPQLPEKTSS